MVIFLCFFNFSSWALRWFTERIPKLEDGIVWHSLSQNERRWKKEFYIQFLFQPQIGNILAVTDACEKNDFLYKLLLHHKTTTFFNPTLKVMRDLRDVTHQYTNLKKLEKNVRYFLLTFAAFVCSLELFVDYRENTKVVRWDTVTFLQSYYSFSSSSSNSNFLDVTLG